MSDRYLAKNHEANRYFHLPMRDTICLADIKRILNSPETFRECNFDHLNNDFDTFPGNQLGEQNSSGCYSISSRMPVNQEKLGERF